MLNPRQFHEMSRQEFESQPGTYFHGSASGVIGGKPGHPQFHVGGHRAALQALGARLHGGAPGYDRENPDAPYHAAITHARQTHAPNAGVVGGRIVGPMANMPMEDPRPNKYGRSGSGDYQGRAPYAYGDFIAGGMENRLKKQGVFYKNQGEGDEGEISAILPNRSHFMTHEDYLVKARGEGKTIPPHATQGYKEIPGQQQLPFGH